MYYGLEKIREGRTDTFITSIINRQSKLRNTIVKHVQTVEIESLNVTGINMRKQQFKNKILLSRDFNENDR